MNRENPNLDSIPLDLFLKIFSRFPTKLVGQCRCVSKLWASILCSQDFNELFLTRSSTRPRLLFTLEKHNGGWLFYSSPHPQNPLMEEEEESINVTADFHSTIPTSTGKCSYASGLLCFRDVQKKDDDHDSVSVVICNPMTGRYKILPKLIVDDGEDYSKTFLGFDPIDKKFKVFFITSKTAHILTLGTTRELSWREIQYFPFTHKPLGEGICINGILYYLAETTYLDQKWPYVIVLVDVRSEKLIKFIYSKINSDELINYMGKLGMVHVYYCSNSGISFTCIIRVWVLEDSEEEEWSYYVYEFPVEGRPVYSVDGMTATGEIVMTERWKKPYYVLERVDIQWLGGNHEELTYCRKGYTFVDHVEDLSVQGSLI